MYKRIWVSLGVLAAVIVVLSVAAAPLAGQGKPSTAAPAAKSYTPPKTPWGHPDLQGIYTSDDYINVPLERPVEFGERFYLTDKEVADREAQIAAQSKADLQTAVAPNARVTTGPPGHWGERAKRSPRQTSRIVDPPDGRIPPLTPLGQKRQRETQAARQAPPDSWENFSYYIRCISRGVTGSIFPVIYGNGTQIIQSPDYVAILHEMVHEARIIPLNNTPHAGPGIRNYMGDSRGRWEGNTLVVETTNFVDNKVGIGQGGPTPTSDALRLMERFTRTDPLRSNTKSRSTIRRYSQNRGQSRFRSCRNPATRIRICMSRRKSRDDQQPQRCSRRRGGKSRKPEVGQDVNVSITTGAISRLAGLFGDDERRCD